MKTRLMFLMLVLPAMVSCNSQDLKMGKQKEDKKKPHEKITVNRKYDEQGNLIEYDSTYTSFYSDFMGDSLMADSIMNNFGLFFDDHFPSIMSQGFMLRDSLFNLRFFHHDFFENQFFEQDEMMLRMMREMDSLKNEFFRMQNQTYKQEQKL